MLMHMKQKPEDQESAESKNRYRTLGNLAIGLAFAGGLASYNLLGSESVGRDEIMLHIPMALLVGAIVFFMLQKGRSDKSSETSSK